MTRSGMPGAGSGQDIAIEISLASPDRVAALPDLERRAASLFPAELLAPEIAAQARPLVEYEQAAREGRLIVARGGGDVLLGFVLLLHFEDAVHLEEVDVDPDYGRRGVGRRLVQAACGWACQHRSDSITLSTFRELAWNAPFYARLGFEEIAATEWTSRLRDLRQDERRAGLDVELRVIMRRRVTESDRASFAPRVSLAGGVD